MSKENDNIKLVPELRFKEFNGEWKETTVGDNCLLKGRIGYRGYTKEDLVEGGQGAIVIGGKHIQNQKLNLSDPTFLSWEKYYESPEIIVEINHIVFSQRGSLGDCAIIEGEIGKATINPSMVLLKDISCNPKFLFYVLIGNRIQREVKRVSTSSAVPMLSQKQIKEFPFEIPTTDKEQQKIAATLSSLDNLIAVENEKLEALQAHKKGLLQQLFPEKGEKVPKLRFGDFSGEWEEKRISRACEKPFSGGTPKSTNENYYDGEIPFIRSAEINKDKTELFLTQLGYDNSSAKMVKKGDVLIALYGANSGDVAISKIKGAINQAILCLRSKTNNEFLYQYLTLKKEWIISTYLQGGQGNLSGEIIKSVELYFPQDNNEEEEIANCLFSLDDTIATQSEKIKFLKEHKKGLMQQLFPNLNTG